MCPVSSITRALALSVTTLLAAAGAAPGQVPAITGNGSLGRVSWTDGYYTMTLNTDAMTIDICTPAGGYSVGGACPAGTHTGPGDPDGCARLVAQSGGQDIVVFDFTTVHITTTAYVRGSRPAAIAATDWILIGGAISVQNGYAGATVASSGVGTAGSGPGGGAGGAGLLRGGRLLGHDLLRHPHWRRRRSRRAVAAHVGGARLDLEHGRALGGVSGLCDDGGDADWEIRGVGDHATAGTAGVLWRHATTGQIASWTMNGATPVTVKYLGRVDDLNFRVAGVGDTNGDTRADVFWRHTTTGDVWVWLMDGTSISSAGLVATVGDLNYLIAGTRDNNADGRVEVLWRHQTTGALWMWTVNGVSITSVTWVGTVPDTGYQVQNPK